MLADEVTHVKMGSDWLRRLTADDADRQKQALEFQRAVDKVFSFGGFRGEQEENPVHLARNFRRLAGFSEEEISDLVDIAAEAYAEAAGPGGGTRRDQRLTPDVAVAAGTTFAATLLELHTGWAWFVIIGNGLAGVWALAANWLPSLLDARAWWFTGVAELTIFVQVALGVGLVAGRGSSPKFHMFYGFVAIIAVAIIYSYRAQMRHRLYLLYGLGGLFLMGLGIRAMLVGQT